MLRIEIVKGGNANMCGFVNLPGMLEMRMKYG
jgi:hypothetical protein